MTSTKPNEERSEELQLWMRNIQNVFLVAAVYSIFKVTFVVFHWWSVACIIAGVLVNIPRLISIFWKKISKGEH